MRIKRLKLMVFIFIGTISMFSCERVKHTTYSMLVINESTKNYVVEDKSLQNLDTILVPITVNSHLCGVSILSTSNYNEVLKKFSIEEFNDKVSTLAIFYFNSANEKVHYGGYDTYCRKYQNWEYDYSEDDGYGLHEYILRLKD